MKRQYRSAVTDVSNSTGAGSKRLLKHSSIYALGSVLKNIIGFIMLPLYTRYLSPADYGVISLMLLMLSLMELLFGARLGYAIPKMYAEADTQQDKKILISTALIFMFVIGALSSTAVFFTRFTLSDVIFGAHGPTQIVAYFSVLVLTQSLETHGLDYIRLQQRPWLFLGMSLFKLAIQLSLNIWLIVFMKMGVIGVALSTAGSSAIVAVVLAIYTVLKTGIRYDKQLAYKMLAFSWPMWFAGLAGLYIGSANRYYMRIFSSMDNIGLYALADRFSGIMVMLIWQPFSQYWMVESFKYYQEGNRTAFIVVFRIICASFFITGLGISMFAGPVIHVMSSKAFHPAASAVPLLVLGTIFACLANFTSFSFLATENTKVLSAYSYVTAAVVTLLYIVLIPPFGYVGAAAAMAAAQGIQLLITYVHGRLHYDMGVSMNFLFTAWGVSTVAYLLGNFCFRNTGFAIDLSARLISWLGATLLIVYWLLHDEVIRVHVLEVMPAPLRPLLTRVMRDPKMPRGADS